MTFQLWRERGTNHSSEAQSTTLLTRCTLARRGGQPGHRQLFDDTLMDIGSNMSHVCMYCRLLTVFFFDLSDLQLLCRHDAFITTVASTCWIKLLLFAICCFQFTLHSDNFLTTLWWCFFCFSYFDCFVFWWKTAISQMGKLAPNNCKIFDWLIDLLIHWLFDWLTDLLIDWLARLPAAVTVWNLTTVGLIGVDQDICTAGDGMVHCNSRPP